MLANKMLLIDSIYSFLYHWIVFVSECFEHSHFQQHLNAIWDLLYVFKGLRLGDLLCRDVTDWERGGSKAPLICHAFSLLIRQQPLNLIFHHFSPTPPPECFVLSSAVEQNTFDCTKNLCHRGLCALVSYSLWSYLTYKFDTTFFRVFTTM